MSFSTSNSHDIVNLARCGMAFPSFRILFNYSSSLVNSSWLCNHSASHTNRLSSKEEEALVWRKIPACCCSHLNTNLSFKPSQPIELVHRKIIVLQWSHQLHTLGHSTEPLGWHGGVSSRAEPKNAVYLITALVLQDAAYGGRTREVYKSGKVFKQIVWSDLIGSYKHQQEKSLLHLPSPWLLTDTTTISTFWTLYLSLLQC